MNALMNTTDGANLYGKPMSDARLEAARIAGKQAGKGFAAACKAKLGYVRGETSKEDAKRINADFAAICQHDNASGGAALALQSGAAKQQAAVLLGGWVEVRETPRTIQTIVHKPTQKQAEANSARVIEATLEKAARDVAAERERSVATVAAVLGISQEEARARLEGKQTITV